MNVYVCTDFEGHYPVGVSAIVIADSSANARFMLANKLRSIGLPQSDALNLRKVLIDMPQVIILQDGNY
jgi:hypothetical protein